MAKRFDFRKRVNGTAETFYPKTSTDNVVRETPNGEKKLDDILDEKGAFMQYTEQVADESTGNDLLFEVLGDVIDSETIKSIKGTIIGELPPEDTRYLWIDKSGETAAMKYYNADTETWEPVTIGGTSSGSGTIISDTEPTDKTALWIDTSSSESVLKYYNPTEAKWVAITSSSSGTGIRPQAMKSIYGTYDIALGKYKLKFEEPSDTVVEGQTLCTVEKVIIVKKKDSEPSSVIDGTIVATISSEDFGTHVDTFLIDDALSPEIGDIYYYKAFPLSDGGLYNTASSNSTGPLECVSYHLYGFTIDPNESDPASCVTYIEENANFKSAKMNYDTDTFEYGDWEDAWFIKNLNPCMLNYDGTVAYSLDKNDYSKKADGTASDIANTSFAGNAMVGIPKVYTKITNNADGTVSVYFSDVKIDDEFNCYAHIDSAGNEMDYTYMPIYNGSNVSSKMRSISGQAVSNNTTVDTEITYAKANNLNSDTIWHTEVLSDRMLINLLLVLIGKSTDSQTVFGTGNTNGYVSSSDYGLLNTGTMNTKGLFWGNQDTKSGVKVFGIENWWGNIRRRIAGWINNKGSHKIKLTAGQADGSTTDGYNTTGDGYIPISGLATASGYITKMLGNKFGLFPSATAGSSSTYYGDYFYTNNSDVYYANVGGTSNSGLNCGPWYSSLNNTVSVSNWNVGASISCKPLAQKG